MTRQRHLTPARVGEPRATFDRLVAIETDDCIEWPHSLNGYGYGQLLVDGRPRLVHALACALRHGPRPIEPTRMDAAHSCGNRACLNPRHLRWATRKENVADRVLHGTALRGQQVAASKLAETDVLAIRTRGLTENQSTLAAEYGVCQQLISMIVHRKRWTWLEDSAAHEDAERAA